MTPQMYPLNWITLFFFFLIMFFIFMSMLYFFFPVSMKLENQKFNKVFFNCWKKCW